MLFARLLGLKRYICIWVGVVPCVL